MTLTRYERVHFGDRNPHRAADVHDAQLALVDQLVQRRSSDTQERGRFGDTQEQRVTACVAAEFVTYRRVASPSVLVHITEQREPLRERDKRAFISRSPGASRFPIA